MPNLDTHQRPLSGRNYSTDEEILGEIGEALANEIGDVRYGSVVVDHLRHQIIAKVEDGRTMRLTCIIE